MHKALLIANRKHLSSEINGGVQLCTHDFIELFKMASFELIFFPIAPTRKILDRVKIKLHIDSYNNYNAHAYLKDLFHIVDSQNIEFVILNQVNLMQFGALIKAKFKNRVKIIVLSHGNESGDFIHGLVREKPGYLKRYLGKLKLGRLLYQESVFFSYVADYILVISEVEEKINLWLGAEKVFFVPRVFKKKKIKRKPVKGRFGFLATLNHPPNKIGFENLCKEVEKLKPDFHINLIGSPVSEGKYFDQKYSFVHYLGYLDDERVEEEMQTWTYFLNPVFWYSRGASTKLAYALERGIPVISTKAGNRGYTWENGTLVTVENPSQMAQAMQDLFQKEKYSESEVDKILTSGPSYETLASKLKDFLSI